MRLKYFIRGLGIGILATTFVLYFAYSVRLSDAQVIKKAKELGLVESIREETTTKSETTTKLETTKQSETTSNVEKPLQNETNTSEELTFTIYKGYTSDDVSYELKKVGLIDDVSKFNNYLIANGYSKRLKVGVFDIKEGSDYEKIAKIITGQ